MLAKDSSSSAFAVTAIPAETEVVIREARNALRVLAIDLVTLFPFSLCSGVDGAFICRALVALLAEFEGTNAVAVAMK
jgi:hypothetical protein